MPNITLEQLLQNQNDFINARTAEINQLKSDVSTALEELNTLANREYSYAHTPLVMNSLEADYNAIITANSDLANLSAIGIRAELKHSETIYKQGNIMFVNGVLAENDYSFSGTNSEGGTEVVNIWYFENNNSLTLADCGFNVVEIRILNKLTPPTVDGSYYVYADEIYTEAYTTTLKPTARKMTVKNQAELSQTIPDYAVYFESDATALTLGNRELAAKSTLKKLYLPELKQTSATNNTYIQPCFGQNGFSPYGEKFDVIIDFPKLEKVFSGRNDTAPVFNGIKAVIIPESVKEIENYCCGNNDTVILNCKNATSISDSWHCPQSNKVYALNKFTLCEDWGASINIAVAATNWSIDDYIDLFENKLRNMGSETRNITIPSAVLAELDEEVITAVTAKGWTLGGA